MKVLALVERGKGKRNFSCHVPQIINNCGLGGFGGTAREAMKDMELSLQEYKEKAAAKGESFPDVEFDYRFDVGAFFNYYPIDVTAFAKYIGMNASVLRQYATAIRQPRADQLQKIRKGIETFSRDLGANLMISQPIASYID